MKNKLADVAAAIALIGLVSSASADIVYETWTGTVISGYDQTGVFLPAGRKFNGEIFTAQYKFDTAVGISDNRSYLNDIHGGWYYAAPSPSLGATLTINGVSRTIDGSYWSELYGQNDGTGTFSRALSAASDYSYGALGSSRNYVFNTIHRKDGAIPLTITVPFTANSMEGANNESDFYFNTDSQTGEVFVSAYGRLSSTSVTLTNVTLTTPEPTTLALVGAALCGVAATRRRRATNPHLRL